MFRTLKWFFKKPWGLYKVLQHPHETIIITKAFIISNWYNDVENSNINKEFKKKLIHFVHRKTGLKPDNND